MLPLSFRRLLRRSTTAIDLLYSAHHHYCSTTSVATTATTTSLSPPPLPPSAATAHSKHLQSCIASLPSSFTPSELSSAILSISDPDLAYDLFRWAALRPSFGHSSLSYHTILRISIYHRRSARAESLIREILSGACPAPDLPLLHTALRFCCTRPGLLHLALDLLNLLPRLSLRPSIDTFHPLLTAISRRVDRHPAYMPAIRSLARRMADANVAPDTLASNLLIRAHSRCLEMDDAIRVFRQMRFHPNCEPNEYTYGFLTRGMCEKGRIGEGLSFYREMRGKGLLPSARVYMTLVNCLSMDRRYAEAIEVVRDMLANEMRPDLLTCRTLIEGLAREGREEEVRGLLQELRKHGAVGERTYNELVDGLRWLCPEFRL